MTLHAAVITKDGTGRVTITPDPVIVEEGDRLVWFCRDGNHEGRFDNANPTDKDRWKGPRNEASAPALEVNARSDDHFPYTVEIDDGSGFPHAFGHSEVVVVGH